MKEKSLKKCQPIAGWMGGKRMLAKHICNIIDNTEHICYAEPFVGMGGIILRRNKPAKSEIINDYNGDVVNMFTIVQKHPQELKRVMEWQLTSRDEFNKIKLIPTETLTDIERAAKFIYLQRIAFGGKINGHYGLDTTGCGRFSTLNLFPLITKLHERLNKVQITNFDWAEFINKVDRKHTLFYLDPPYWGHENDYGKDMFDRSQFSTMADILSNLKGKFVLSLNDLPEIRQCFNMFIIKEVNTIYSAAGNDKQKPARELIISNFDY